MFEQVFCSLLWHVTGDAVVVEENPLLPGVIALPGECGVVAHGLGTAVQHTTTQGVRLAAELEHLIDPHWSCDFGALVAESLQMHDEIVRRSTDCLLLRASLALIALFAVRRTIVT